MNGTLVEIYLFSTPSRHHFQRNGKKSLIWSLYFPHISVKHRCMSANWKGKRDKVASTRVQSPGSLKSTVKRDAVSLDQSILSQDGDSRPSRGH
jgi:hypothetical protein